jgi:hypothetical protein
LHAFVLKAEQVNNIWKALADAVGQVEATASCVDHMNRPFTSAEALIAYPNARARQITRLEFWAQSEDRRQHAYLSLTGTYGMMTFRAQGCEPTVSRLKDQLADILDGMRPWYSSIARLDIATIMSGIVLFALLMWNLTSIGRLRAWATIEDVPFWLVLLSVMLSIGAMALVAVGIWGLYKLHRRFFPMGTFAIGQGEERYRVAEWIRAGILMGPLLVGIGLRSLLSMLWSLAFKIGASP